MALVSYDYDSGSENEEEDQESVITPQKPNEENDRKAKNQNATNSTEDTLTEVPELLTHLPRSKSSSAAIEEEKLEDFVPKYQPPAKEKQRKKIKITIPSLSEFQDVEDEEPEEKRKRTQPKGSNLLAMLPPVRGSPLSTKSFVPHIVKNKQKTAGKPTADSSLVPNAVRRKAELSKMAAIQKVTKAAGSDAESDDDIEMPETFDDEMWQKVCGRPARVKEVVLPVPEDAEEDKGINIAPEAVKPYDGLDNAAFKELVGRSKRPVNIKLIDINEEEVLPDKNVWLTKSLTDPDTAAKPVVENPVDPTRKKKHHITYLAEQAKANEQELQSQWSASKFTRNQTRAKYGF